MDVYLADIIFDSKERRLKKGKDFRSLEPKVFSLLVALIEANGDIVSREQLINDVWKKRVVGEGAINRTVSLLRSHMQALTDSEIIETVPTQGYRLTTESIKSIESQKTNNDPVPKAQLLTRTTSLILLSIVLTLLSFFYYIHSENLNTNSQLTLVSGPMIGLKGWEYGISVTQSGEKILFHHRKETNHQSVYLYDTETHSKKVILTNALAAIDASGEKVVYAAIKNEKCSIGIYHTSTEKSTPLFSCEEPPTSLVWGDNGTFYFNKRFSKSHPFQIFSFNVNTKNLQQITAPNSQNNTKGDFQFSFNRTTEQLAIIRYINENQSLIVIYSNKEQVSEYHIKFRVKNLVWHPNQQEIILSDKNSIYQLNTHTGNVSETRQFAINIKSLAILPNKVTSNLLISSSNVVTEIVKFDIKDKKNKVWQTSARAELLPRIQADTKLILSTRYKSHHWWKVLNGKEELINANLPFDLKFVRYEISEDGQYILFTKNGDVYQLEIETSNFKKLFSDNRNSYVANYDTSNENAIIYSSNQSGQWQLWRYKQTLNTHEQLTFQGGYSGRIVGDYLYYSKYTQDGLWRKNNASEKEELIIQDFDRINWLNWQIINDKLYFYREQSGIWQFDLTTRSEALVMKNPDNMIHQYTVSPEQQFIYWVRLKGVEGDIYQYEF